MPRSQVAEALAVAYAVAERHSSRSMMDYLRHVVIDSRPEPMRFGLIAQPWQWEQARRIVPALEAVSGLRSDYTGPRRIWETMPRGHDKTSSIGRYLNHLLCWSKRKLRLYTAASDAEQAGLIVESMHREAELNPWIANRLQFASKTIRGKGGVLTVLSADAASSFGKKPDVLIIDEITWWQKKDLFDAMFSAMEKMPGSVVINITNAGVTGSWQWELLQEALASRKWSVFQVPPKTHLATWMSAEAIAGMRRMLTRGIAKRVIDNLWIDPAEEAEFLTREEINACADRGRDLTLAYRSSGVYGVDYVVGVDYGPRRDRTALVVLHHEKEANGPGRIVIDKLDVWQGSPDAPIPIANVEAWLDDVAKQFHHPKIICDKYELEGTIQKFEANHDIERFEPRGGKRTYEMAATLRSLIVNRQLVWYAGAGDLVIDGGRVESFVDELCGLVIKPTPYGYRFDHEAKFHDDRAVAVGMAALYAARDLPVTWVKPTKVVTPSTSAAVKELVRGGSIDWDRHGDKRGRDVLEIRRDSSRELYGVRV